MKQKESSPFKEIMLPTLIGMVAALAVLFFIKTEFRLVIVDGSSMNPTYYNGDLLQGAKPVKELQRGDIITFRENGQTLIKRIVGLPGETISWKGGYLYINGARMITDFPKMQDGGILDEKTITLTDDEYFCLGDNRNNSMDSRVFGPVKKSQISLVITDTIIDTRLIKERIFGHDKN